MGEGERAVEARVLEAVAEVYDLTTEAVRIGGRTKRVAEARQLAYFVLRHKFHKSHQSIGEYFRRDHSTVVYGCRRIERGMLFDIGLQSNLDHVMLLLGDLVQACPVFVVMMVAGKPVDFVSPVDRDSFQICRRCHLPRGVHADAAAASSALRVAA